MTRYFTSTTGAEYSTLGHKNTLKYYILDPNYYIFAFSRVEHLDTCVYKFPIPSFTIASLADVGSKFQ